MQTVTREWDSQATPTKRPTERAADVRGEEECHTPRAEVGFSVITLVHSVQLRVSVEVTHTWSRQRCNGDVIVMYMY